MKLSLPLLTTAFATTVMSNTVVYVYNLCPYNIYVDNFEITPSQSYATDTTTSVNVSRNPDGTSPARVETNDTGSILYYDLSLINCDDATCPFGNSGVDLQASDPNCPQASCGSNRDTCQNVYLNANDDGATLSCASGSSVSLYVC